MACQEHRSANQHVTQYISSPLVTEGNVAGCREHALGTSVQRPSVLPVVVHAAMKAYSNQMRLTRRGNTVLLKAAHEQRAMCAAKGDLWSRGTTAARTQYNTARKQALVAAALHCSVTRVH